MSVNSLVKRLKKPGAKPHGMPFRSRVLRVALLLVWMAAGFGLALTLIDTLLYLLDLTGVPLREIDDTVFKASFMAVLYALTAAVIIGVPWLVSKRRTSREELGLRRLMSWGDIGLAPLGLVVYLLLAWLFVAIAPHVISSLDLSQTQDTGFSGMQMNYQYLVAMIALVGVAPAAEELLFRGYLYGKLRKVAPIWMAVLITSLLFALVHGQWNVGIDVFALSLVLCGLREITGNIWAGMLLHMLKNAIAYYALFIYPLM